jgi:hypothetical protein
VPRLWTRGWPILYRGCPLEPSAEKHGLNQFSKLRAHAASIAGFAGSSGFSPIYAGFLPAIALFSVHFSVDFHRLLVAN